MDDAILLARSFWVDAERPVRWRAYAALAAILSLQVAKGKMAAVVSHAGRCPVPSAQGSAVECSACSERSAVCCVRGWEFPSTPPPALLAANRDGATFDSLR